MRLLGGRLRRGAGEPTGRACRESPAPAQLGTQALDGSLFTSEFGLSDRGGLHAALWVGWPQGPFEVVVSHSIQNMDRNTHVFAHVHVFPVSRCGGAWMPRP